MPRYTPTAVPNDTNGLRAWIAGELRRLADSLMDQEFIQLQPRGVAPTRPRPGMIACADGVAWNPGAGAGVYEFRGGTWQKL